MKNWEVVLIDEEIGRLETTDDIAFEDEERAQSEADQRNRFDKELQQGQYWAAQRIQE